MTLHTGFILWLGMNVGFSGLHDTGKKPPTQGVIGLQKLSASLVGAQQMDHTAILPGMGSEREGDVIRLPTDTIPLGANVPSLN